ncbi:uncharacterized protein THITE_123729 [Thermothielavioides terrestris NRRL 8126]|uniref:DUF2461 domain-containing protein n=1 Tax=Thermothielavioides terrestris (strain ATCC 38088 / NRRL 8126) TaxID=578455 RepID=G2QSR2_THETT|nr:uncharacterized protein THITE_123729 [Thermothielavioides terrestris NRRL 8126]AEO64345.1 hypothetical protein THITE_123729 [Thermothielavioides terrestris NRRL 8126]
MAAQKRKSAAGAGAAPATPEAHAPSSRRRSQRKARGRGRRPAKRAKGAQPEAESDGSGDDYKEEAAGKAAEESGDDEFDEAAPPKVTFVPLPKLRDTGGVEYADDRLHPNTLAFLADLKANNKRSWLKAHDGEYRRALKDWETYVMALTERIIAADPTIPELPFKDVNFRIYRDIRFSNDPTPYKPHFSAAFSRTGRKGPYACYYVHVEPAGAPCFVGGGLWHPGAAALARLRASIDERPRRWRRVLNEPAFREVFLGLRPAGKRGAGGGRRAREDPAAAALAAFAERNQEGALKTRPKGFVPDHRDMQLLKLRNFTVSRKMDASVFMSPGGLDEVARVIRAMVGFVTHLNRIVMPDPGDDDDESDEE